jgi:hypothetical protein
MKKITFTILFFMISTTLLIAQQTEAQKWFSYSIEYKAVFIDGFAAGIRVYTDLIPPDTKNESLIEIRGFVIDILMELPCEKTAFWTSLIDSFYLKQGNEKVNISVAVTTVMYDYFKKFNP